MSSKSNRVENKTSHQSTLSLAQSLSFSDIEWKENEQYPSWVNLNEVGLDQFYTNVHTVEYCLDILQGFLNDRKISLDDCVFVEPSAGSGSFSNALFAYEVIAMDLEPAPLYDSSSNFPIIEKQDFLTWDPLSEEAIANAHDNNKTIVCIGNPPFGYRGWLALAFMNKCAIFADYCAFILPMSFASEGKGSPKYRVNDMRCVSNFELMKEEFITSDKISKFNVVYQIWEKGENKKPDYSLVDDVFEIKFVCDISYRSCGQKFKEKADVFVSQAYYDNNGMVITNVWEDVLYASAYGVRIKNQQQVSVDELTKALNETDWNKYSTSATHGCRHVGMSEIKQALADSFNIEIL